jgi:hemerythrin-like metal-binding protein
MHQGAFIISKSYLKRPSLVADQVVLGGGRKSSSACKKPNVPVMRSLSGLTLWWLREQYMSNYNRPEFSCMKSVVHIDWSESLNSGLSEVDEQHRTLVGLINDLGVYHGGGAAVSGVLTVFQKLEHYSVYHFESEESLMRDHGVCEKDYQEHCRSHRAFVTLLQQARGLVATCPDEVVQQLTAYLLKWLVFHIGGEDMRMAHAIVARSGEGRSTPEVPTWKLDGTLVSCADRAMYLAKAQGGGGASADDRRCSTCH